MMPDVTQLRQDRDTYEDPYTVRRRWQNSEITLGSYEAV